MPRLRARPRQHHRRLKTGRTILVNKGVKRIKKKRQYLLIARTGVVLAESARPEDLMKHPASGSPATFIKKWDKKGGD